MPSEIRRALIADDEPLARARIRLLLEKHRRYEIVGEATNGTEAVEAIVSLAPDVIFLDIRMPGLSGIEVAQAVDAGEGPAPAIVFVSAHDEFALAAFDVSAADYLLKPVERARFDRALERVEARIGGGARATPGDLDPAIRVALERLNADRTYPKRFLVRASKGLYFVQASDIEWVDAQGNYMRLHAAGKAHMVRATMKTFERQLDPDRFVRVHRSAIVAIDRIERIEPRDHGEYLITMKDGARLTSSRAHSEALRLLLK